MRSRAAGAWREAETTAETTRQGGGRETAATAGTGDTRRTKTATKDARPTTRETTQQGDGQERIDAAETRRKTEKTKR